MPDLPLDLENPVDATIVGDLGTEPLVDRLRPERTSNGHAARAWLVPVANMETGFVRLLEVAA